MLTALLNTISEKFKSHIISLSQGLMLCEQEGRRENASTKCRGWIKVTGVSSPLGRKGRVTERGLNVCDVKKKSHKRKLRKNDSPARSR